MSLKSALMQYKESKADKEIMVKIQAMLDEQRRLLGEGLDISKDGDIVKVKKEWNDDILMNGGVSYYKLNNKWYRVSVCNGDNDIVLKYWFKNALDIKVSISSKALKEAQQVVDSIYGKGKYAVSASKN